MTSIRGCVCSHRSSVEERKIKISVYKYWIAEHKNMTWAIKHAKKSNTLVQYSQIPACRFLLVCYRGFALWLLWTVVTEKEKPLLAVITFPPFRNPCFISPQTRSRLSVSPGELHRISLLHELSLLHYAISISSHLNPFSPACSLTLTISLVLHFIFSSRESF